MRKKIILTILLLCTVGGCTILAHPTYILFGDHNPKVEAAYDGLAQKHVALIVAGDPGIDFEYPYLTTNLALMGAKHIGLQVEEVSFVEQEKLDMFMQRSSLWIGLDKDQIKKKFGVQRLIYVELVRLTLQEENSINLLRGRLIAEIKVYDLEESYYDQPVYESEIQIVIPEGAAVYASDSAEQKILQKLMVEFTIRFAWTFYEHREER